MSGIEDTRMAINRAVTAVAHDNTPAGAACRMLAAELAKVVDAINAIAVHLGSAPAHDPDADADLRAQVNAIAGALGEHGIVVANTDWRPGETVLVSTHVHEQPPPEQPPPEAGPQDPPSDQQQGQDGPAADGGAAPPI